jgi:hypothetical protein
VARDRRILDLAAKGIEDVVIADRVGCGRDLVRKVRRRAGAEHEPPRSKARPMTVTKSRKRPPPNPKRLAGWEALEWCPPGSLAEGRCNWTDCAYETADVAELLGHLQEAHHVLLDRPATRSSRDRARTGVGASS